MVRSKNCLSLVYSQTVFFFLFLLYFYSDVNRSGLSWVFLICLRNVNTLRTEIRLRRQRNQGLLFSSGVAYVRTTRALEPYARKAYTHFLGPEGATKVITGIEFLFFTRCNSDRGRQGLMLLQWHEWQINPEIDLFPRLFFHCSPSKGVVH